MLYYEMEWAKYPEHFKTRFNMQRAQLICRKLLRHFKINAIVYFNKRNRGSASYSWNIIRLPKNNISLGMIVHEIGHLRCVARYGREGRGHHKKLASVTRPIFSYSTKFIAKPELEVWQGNDIY